MRAYVVFAALLCNAAGAWAADLVTDGGFEKDVVGMSGPDTEVWGRFASVDPMGLKIVQDPGKRANQVLRIAAREEPGAYQGIFQKVPVKGGENYLVTVQILDDSATPLSPGSTGLLSVEWKDDEGNEVGREDGKPWTGGLSGTDWETVTFETRAPASATQAHFVILQRNPENGAAIPGGAFLVDNFSVVEK